MKLIYTYLSFDNFCRLKEYPHSISKELKIPSWKYYFDQNNIEIIRIDSLGNSLESVRIFFKNVSYIDKYKKNVSKKIYMKYGMDKFDSSLIQIGKDLNFIDVCIEQKLCVEYLKDNGLFRDPYYLTMNEIIDSNYIKLLGYIIYVYFDEINVSYLLYPVKLSDGELLNRKKKMCAIRMAIHTDKGYIIKKIREKTNRIDSLENAILKRDFAAVVFLIKEIEMTPTKSNMKLIKKYIPQLEKPLDLLF